MLIFNSMVLFTLVAEIQFAYEWWETKRDGCIRRQKYNETVMRDKNKHKQVKRKERLMQFYGTKLKPV